MDQYQEYLLARLHINPSFPIPRPGTSPVQYSATLPPNLKPRVIGNAKNIEPFDMSRILGGFEFKEGKIRVRQNENYHVTVYGLKLRHPSIDEVWTIKNGKRVLGTVIDERTKEIEIDFAEKTPSVFVSFRYDLADPIEIPIEYTDADREAWEEKERARRAAELEKVVDIKVTTGASLVNILFNPADSTYKRATAKLYFAELGPNRIVNGYRFLGEYDAKRGRYFIAIGGLGEGKYAFELFQYGKGREVIFESKKIPFSISGGAMVINPRPVNIIQ